LRFGICIIACSYGYDYCQCHPLITCLLLKKLYCAVSFDIHDVPEKNDPKVFFRRYTFLDKTTLRTFDPIRKSVHVLVICLLHDDLAFIPVSFTHWKVCECYQLSSVIVVLNSFWCWYFFSSLLKLEIGKTSIAGKLLKTHKIGILCVFELSRKT